MESKSYISLKLNHSLKGSEGPFQLSLDLQLAQGETMAISGESGAGKTSLLRILAGLMQADEAKLTVEGETWIDSENKINLSPQARSAGMVFQDYTLFPHMSVQENLFFALKKGADKQWPIDTLRQMGLWELRDQKPHQLSGGQKQRVAIIRALIQKPKLLLLDEPLSALDEALRRQIQQEIKAFQQETNTTILWVSHSLIELSTVADRVLLLKKGKILQLGPPEVVLQQGNQEVWEGEILKVLTEGEYWIRVGNNPYKIFLEGNRKVGDKIYISPTVLPMDKPNNS